MIAFSVNCFSILNAIINYLVGKFYLGMRKVTHSFLCSAFQFRNLCSTLFLSGNTVQKLKLYVCIYACVCTKLCIFMSLCVYREKEGKLLSRIWKGFLMETASFLPVLGPEALPFIWVQADKTKL